MLLEIMTSLGLLWAAPLEWQSPARLHNLFRKAIPGTIVFGGAGIEFRSAKFSTRWTFTEIRTFDLPEAREFILTGYENRRWHEPGEQRFRFTLDLPVPPSVAAEVAKLVGKPVRNGDPDPSAALVAAIPAHHRARIGGSNGVLHFRSDGIAYVTPDGHDGRSWRWSDIQTIANPNPWEFRVTAWREIVEWELKQPLSRDLFDQIWDRLYAQRDVRP